MNIIKFLSYEARITEFVKVNKKYFQMFEKKMGKKVIRKWDFLKAVSRIEFLLLDIHNSNVVYRKTRNKKLKEHIKQNIKSVSSNKRQIVEILEENKNYYNAILLPQMMALCENAFDIL